MWQLVNLCTDSIYLLHIRFNASRQHLYFFTAPIAAPVQLQLRLVGFCLRLGPTTPWAMARQNLGSVVLEICQPIVFQIISLEFVRFRNSQRIRYY